MKTYIKLVLNIMGIVILFSSISVAEKKIAPIFSDDIISFTSYYTSTNNLKVPIPSYENEYNELVVQCEEDISYFIMSYQYYDKALVTVNSGEVVIDENMTTDGIVYIKGHIEGNESMDITGSVYFDNELRTSTTKTCRSNVTSVNTLEVPTFNGNSQGKLVIQCEDDVVYYIMAYDCLRSWTNPTASTDNGNLVIDEKRHVGEIFYVKGHVKRTSGSVTITGKLLNEFDTRSWIETCP